MRLFVALDVTEDVRERISAALERLRRDDDELRWTRPEGWHVTLAFLGEVTAPADVVTAAVARGVAAAGVAGPIRLRLDQPGRFGRRVAWLGIADEPSGAVARLGEAIQTELEEADLPVDRKQVHAHITVARPRGRRSLPRDLVAELPDLEEAWTVEDVVVFRSVTDSSGAVYDELARIPLEGR